MRKAAAISAESTVVATSIVDAALDLDDEHYACGVDPTRAATNTSRAMMLGRTR